MNEKQEIRTCFIHEHTDEDVAVYALSRDLSFENIGKMLDVVGVLAR